MKGREHYLFRAARLREAQAAMDDSLVRTTLEALIQTLDEAARDAERLFPVGGIQ